MVQRPSVSKTEPTPLPIRHDRDFLGLSAKLTRLAKQLPLAMKLTAQEASSLAREFYDLFLAAGQHRFEHWTEFTAVERSNLLDYQMMLLKFSSQFIAAAVGLVLDDAAGGLERLERVIANAQAILQDQADGKQGIEIAASLARLGTAIMSQSTPAITAAVRNVADTLAD